MKKTIILRWEDVREVRMDLGEQKIGSEELIPVFCNVIKAISKSMEKK